jgi:hypothetical protein
MKPNLLVRVITLSGFTVMMSGFVAYKTGAFETASNVKADSPVKDTLTPMIFAPSSKSGPVFTVSSSQDTVKPKQDQQQSDQKQQAPNQNAAPPKANEQTNQAPAKPNNYMGGSKSKQVFTPEPKDTSKPK